MWATLVRTISLTYDAAGELMQGTDPAGTYGYEYDGAGRLNYQSQSFAGFLPLIEYSRQPGTARRVVAGRQHDQPFRHRRRHGRFPEQLRLGRPLAADARHTGRPARRPRRRRKAGRYQL